MDTIKDLLKKTVDELKQMAADLQLDGEYANKSALAKAIFGAQQEQEEKKGRVAKAQEWLSDNPLVLTALEMLVATRYTTKDEVRDVLAKEMEVHNRELAEILKGFEARIAALEDQPITVGKTVVETAKPVEEKITVGKTVVETAKPAAEKVVEVVKVTAAEAAKPQSAVRRGISWFFNN